MKQIQKAISVFLINPGQHIFITTNKRIFNNSVDRKCRGYIFRLHLWCSKLHKAIKNAKFILVFRDSCCSPIVHMSHWQYGELFVETEGKVYMQKVHLYCFFLGTKMCEESAIVLNSLLQSLRNFPYGVPNVCSPIFPRSTGLTYWLQTKEWILKIVFFS